MGPTTAAIILEPVQGEGGARSWPDADLTAIRKLCDETGTLLIYDEIQCGLEPHQQASSPMRGEPADAQRRTSWPSPRRWAAASRWGRAWLHGRGRPAALTVGSHGENRPYGGNPLAMAVGAGLPARSWVKPELMAHVSARSPGFFTQAVRRPEGSASPTWWRTSAARACSSALQAARPPTASSCSTPATQHLLLAGGGDNCVRLLPPLNVTVEEASEAMAKLERACERARAQAKAAA